MSVVLSLKLMSLVNGDLVTGFLSSNEMFLK